MDDSVQAIMANRLNTQTAPASVAAASRNARHICKRRNGLQPACEPCRKAKVRCDTFPLGSLCSRCKKRKTASHCIFIEAPMTRQFRVSSNEPGLSLPTPQSPSRASHRTAGSSPSTSISTIVSSSVPREFAGPPGFLGSTSFSATIHDHEVEVTDERAEADTGSNTQQDSTQVAMGVGVLELLPDHSDCQILFGHSLEGPGELCMQKPMVQTILESLHTIYQTNLKKPRNLSDLQNMSVEITRNSEAVLILPDDAVGCLGAFSGSNTRWESIGILFTALGYGLLAVPEKDFGLLKLSLTYSDSKKAVSSLKRAVELCLELCKNSLNSLVCLLLCKNVFLETVLHGDTSLSVWRLHRDVLAVASATGLHCYSGDTEVTLRSEIKKRLSACCFWNDIEMSMFTGRPPAWTHRYHSCPLPLDVSDEALLEGGERLQNEIACLDLNGWNTKGHVHNATVCRSMVLSATMFDEIMELFIGNASQWSMDRVRALKVKAVEKFSEIPQILLLTKEKLIRCESVLTMWRLLHIRLDYLRIHFLLERLSAERGNESKQRLVDVAREILDMILFLWLERDRAAIRHLHDYDYIIMCYGMPSTGILCTELLKQTKQPKEVDVKMPCSEVVQNLSLMIGFLEWIRPTAGNYKLCRRMSQVIRRVLDKVFEPAGKEGVQDSEVVPAEDMTDDFLSLDNLDDFEWLNSLDWSRGPYIEMT